MDHGSRPRRHWLALATAASLLASTTGCGEDAPDAAPEPTTTAVAATTPATTPASSTAPRAEQDAVESAFPVTVTAANGEVTIDDRPERIVVLSSSLTETVFGVGAGDQVVAVDSYSDHPADAPTTDLSAFKPNVEAIGALEPDLVLLSRDRDGIVATLDSVGITSLVLPSAADLDEVYDQVSLVGIATGHVDEAEALRADMASSIDEQIARLDGRSLPADYYYELSSDHHSATSDTFVGSILSEIGMVNIADGVDPTAGAYPQLSAEFVLEANPAQIFIAHTGGAVPTLDEIAARPGWATLQAVVDGDVIVLESDIASRWGPRVVELVTAIVDGLLDDS